MVSLLTLVWPSTSSHRKPTECTSLRGGFVVWDVIVVYSSYISSCLCCIILSDNKSRINTSAPCTTLATSFPGIWGRDGEMTIGGCTPGVGMTLLGATEGRCTEWMALVAAEPNSWICCRWEEPGSWPRVRPVKKALVKYSSSTWYNINQWQYVTLKPTCRHRLNLRPSHSWVCQLLLEHTYPAPTWLTCPSRGNWPFPCGLSCLLFNRDIICTIDPWSYSCGALYCACWVCVWHAVEVCELY